MDIAIQTITIISTVIIIIVPFLKYIKSDAEKDLDPYYVRVLKRIFFECFLGVAAILQVFNLPRIILYEYEGVGFYNLLYLNAALFLIYFIIDQKFNIKYLKDIIGKIHIKKLNKIKGFILFIYSFILVIWVISSNNYVLQGINTDLRNNTNGNISVSRYSELFSENEDMQNFKNEIESYNKGTVRIIFKIYLLNYLIFRFALTPLMMTIMKSMNIKVYCNIRLKDGTTFLDSEFISRDSRFIIIKAEKKFKAIFVNIDEIVEIKLSYKNSIFIR